MVTALLALIEDETDPVSTGGRLFTLQPFSRSSGKSGATAAPTGLYEGILKKAAGK